MRRLAIILAALGLASTASVPALAEYRILDAKEVRALIVGHVVVTSGMVMQFVPDGRFRVLAGPVGRSRYTIDAGGQVCIDGLKLVDRGNCLLMRKNDIIYEFVFPESHRTAMSVVSIR